MKCPVCKNDFNEHTGRRPKKFCSDECKVKFWNAQKKVTKNSQPENKKRVEDERNTPHNLGKKNQNSQPIPKDECVPVFKNDIEKQLWDIQQERLKTQKKQ